MRSYPYYYIRAYTLSRMSVCVKLIGQFDCILQARRAGALPGADRRRVRMGCNYRHQDGAGS